MNVTSIIASILSGLTNEIGSLIMGVLAVFVPQLLTVSEQDFEVISANFKKFLADIESGMSWGEAQANMLTADWNEVEDDAKTIATDFADAVGTALEKLGLTGPKNG